MASTQSKSAKASATRSDGESARWIFGLLLLFAGIFLVASVVFYYFDWRGDYSALHGIGSENPNFDDSIDNPCGWAHGRPRCSSAVRSVCSGSSSRSS